MDKRYQVFVSSTFTDLEEERKHIIQTLMEMDCIPAGMELFPATDEEQWDFIKKVIDDCDYYLLLIGGRYGSLSPDGISYTEMEYDYAVSKGMKVIALVHGEPNNLPQIKCEKDSTLQEKLEKFREKVCTGRLVKFWKNADQISGIVSLSLSKTIKTYPAVGWVRANLVPSEDTVQEILRLQNKIKELQEKNLQLKSKPEGLENLCQGEELFNFRFQISAFKGGTARIRRWFETDTSLTWNNIFKFLSPTLIVENNEVSLFETFNKVASNYCISDIQKLIKNEELFNIGDFKTNYEDFNKILIQFRALKLIKLSDKKHPPSDNNVYWALTPYGDQLMTELNAIKRLNY